jgi:Flp pilus assembly protein TadG
MWSGRSMVACRPALARLSQNERGSVAVIFALSLTVLMGAGGLALDMARISSAKGKLQDAADAATLAGARHYARTHNQTEAIAAAQAFFENAKGLNPALAQVTSINPEFDLANMQLRASANLNMRASLSAAIGFQNFALSVTSASALALGNIEVAIMIDLSSSMTGQRFDDAKTALRSFANAAMLGDNASKPVKLAFAPFASAVNPGSYFNAVVDASGSGAQCVGERYGSAQYTDDAPGPGKYFNVFSPEKDWPCLDTPIMPLEKTKATVLSRIDNLELSEGTAGHLGTMWAWYLLSPRWDSIWPTASKPAAYGASTKIAILMTDGENFPKDLPSDEAADDYALQICTNMKAAGITVYSIGFHVSATRAANLLRACASSPDKHYFPFGGSELNNAFRNISNAMTSLRLAK